MPSLIVTKRGERRELEDGAESVATCIYHALQGDAIPGSASVYPLRSFTLRGGRKFWVDPSEVSSIDELP